MISPIMRYREFIDIFKKRNEVHYCDVNENVIEKFEGCEEIDFKFLETLREFFKLDFKENKNVKNCLEYLGVFISPSNLEGIGNIFLSVDRIEKVAKKYNLTYNTLYGFVKTHEEAHSLMCSKIMLQSEKRYISKSFYLFFEEMLATLFALYIFKKHPEIEKLKKFVNDQPLQYKAALSFDEKKVKPMMITWLLFKADALPNSKNDLYYEYIDLEFKEKLEKIYERSLGYVWEKIEKLDNGFGIEISKVQELFNITKPEAVKLMDRIIELKIPNGIWKRNGDTYEYDLIDTLFDI